MLPGYTVGSLFWAEFIIAFSLSTDTKASSPHDDLLLLAQSEMSFRWFCDLLLPSASRGQTIRTPYSYPRQRVIWYTMNPVGSYVEFFLADSLSGLQERAHDFTSLLFLLLALLCYRKQHDHLGRYKALLINEAHRTSRKRNKLKSMACWELGTLLHYFLGGTIETYRPQVTLINTKCLPLY